MSQPNPLELAKQGHPKAIESLINRQTQPKGITAKAALKNNCLHIMLEAAQPPDQKALVPVIRKGITNLGVASIEILKIYGKQAGEQVPAWSQEFELVGKSSPSANSENIETPPKELSLKERAKQGDVAAITKLLNVALLNKNITSKATLKDGCLSVMLESAQVPNEETSARIISRELMNMQVESIERVKIYAKQENEEFPAWNREFELVGQVNSITSNPPITDKVKSFNSFNLQQSQTKTKEQQKIAKSKAYELGAAGAVLGLIISIPSVWAALQMFQLTGGGDFALGYIIGIVIIVFMGYISGFGQGINQFDVNCPHCNHKFTLTLPGASCPACGTSLYIDEQGDCKLKQS